MATTMSWCSCISLAAILLGRTGSPRPHLSTKLQGRGTRKLSSEDGEQAGRVRGWGLDRKDLCPITIEVGGAGLI